MAETSDQPVRCAAWSREIDAAPIGSIGCYNPVVIVEWPQPWPRDISEVDDLRPLHERVAAFGGRLLMAVPRDRSVAEIVLYRQPPNRSRPGPLERTASRGPWEDLVARAFSLLERSCDPKPMLPDGHVDVLICGHGRRDRCCGSMGTTLACSIDDGELGDGVHVRRVSHLGGHRFAPTALIMPSGTAWAFCDLGLLRQVLGRQGDTAAIAHRYRGFIGHADPAVQLLDQRRFAEVGWPWIDRRRDGVRTADGSVALTSETDVGAGEVVTEEWLGEVAIGRLVATPWCGNSVDATTPTEEELTLVSVRRS